MRPIYLLLISTLLLLTLSTSCTVQKATTIKSKKLHSGALEVQPAYQATPSFISKNAVIVGGVVGAAAGLAVDNPLLKNEETTQAQNILINAITGAAVGLFLQRFVPRNSKKQGIQPSQQKEWLRNFNQNSKLDYNLLGTDADGLNLFIVPDQNADAFWNKEREVNAMKRPNNPASISIAAVDFYDESRNGILEPEEEALIEVKISNQDEVPIDQLKIYLDMSGLIEGIQPKPVQIPNKVLPGQVATFLYKIFNTYIEKEGPVSCEVTIDIEGVEKRKMSSKLTRASFFSGSKTNGTTLAFDDTHRLPAIDYLTGKKVVNYPKFRELIDEAIKNGDPKAMLWKAIVQVEQPMVFPSTNAGQVVTLLNKGFDLIKSAAQSEEPEAMYLMSRAYSYGFGTKKDDRIATSMLEKAAVSGYIPAITSLGQEKMAKNEHQSAIPYLQQAAFKGDVRANAELAAAYLEGTGVSQNTNTALQLFKKAENYNMTDAYYQHAKSLLEGKLGIPDTREAISLFETAANLGDSWSMLALVEIYVSEGLGIPQDFSMAVHWLEKAATIGNADAMYNLSLIYASEEAGIRDLNRAHYWTKKAAIEGHGPSANLLSMFYLSPNGGPVEYNEVLGRFWRMEAAAAGEKVEGGAEDYHPLQGFLQNFELKERTQITEYYSGRVERRDYIDPFADGIDALMGMFIQSRMPTGDNVNAAAEVYSVPNQKIYAVTLNNRVNTDISVKAGQKIVIQSRGKIRFGMFAGSANANGMNDPALVGYNRFRDYPHGCLMMRIGEEDNWRKTSIETEFIAPRSGTLQFAVNDRDSSNNANYFDVKVVVTDK